MTRREPTLDVVRAPRATYRTESIRALVEQRCERMRRVTTALAGRLDELERWSRQAPRRTRTK